MARVQPGELGLEPLSSARHTQEGKVQKPEQYSSALSEYRLVYKPGHTPPGHNTKELSVHTQEHKPPLEQHSLAWPCSIWRSERHTMVSSSKG